MKDHHYVPFNGLKVLELASVLAGPLAGSFFSELGAQVIKVENKLTNGEMTRGWKHPAEKINCELSDYYVAANAEKDVVFLDLSDDTDYQTLAKLVSEANIVISNFLPAVAKKLKCGYTDLLKLNERLIFVNLIAYDHHDDRPGFDLLMQAECGYLSMTGSETNPAKMPVAMIDIIASHQIKEAVLIGLYEQASGKIKSAEYQVSLFKSGITGLINQGSSYINSGIIPKPMATLHPSIAPYGDLFSSADGIAFTLAVGTDRQFEKLCMALGLEIKEEFRLNKNRVINRQHLVTYLSNTLSQLDFNTVMNLLNNNSIPFSKINSVNEALEMPLALEMITAVKDNKKRVSDIAFLEKSRT